MVSNLAKPEVDEVTLMGSSSSSLVATGNSQSIIPVEKKTVLSVVNSDLEDEIVINLFPNPAQEYITIESSEEIENLQIVNMSGSIVKSMTHVNSSVEIDISDLAPGAYSVLVRTGMKVNSTKLIKL